LWTGRQESRLKTDCGLACRGSFTSWWMPSPSLSYLDINASRCVDMIPIPLFFPWNLVVIHDHKSCETIPSVSEKPNDWKAAPSATGLLFVCHRSPLMTTNNESAISGRILPANFVYHINREALHLGREYPQVKAWATTPFKSINPPTNHVSCRAPNR
jgi:hypothetical protein